MKLKRNFILQQVAGSWIVMPLGEAAASFDGMLTLNDTGALLWKGLEMQCDRETLADMLTAEYQVTPSRALGDVDKFLDKLREAGCIDELQ